MGRCGRDGDPSSFSSAPCVGPVCVVSGGVGLCGDWQACPAPPAVAITHATTGWSTTHLHAWDHRRCTPATNGGVLLLGSAGRWRTAGVHPLFADATRRRVLCLLQVTETLTNGLRIAPQD